MSDKKPEGREELLMVSRYSGALRGRIDLASSSCIIGLSAGLLAAAAVALSPATPALIPLAVEVVVIAFRIGLFVRSTAANIEVPHSPRGDASWSYALPGMTRPDAENLLFSFHTEKVC